MGEVVVAIHDEGDIVAARRAGRDMARELGFGSADQTRLASAISELARNVLQYAGAGTCTFSSAELDPSTIKLQVVVEDNGPGIPDVDQAMAEGFSTSGGPGLGLPTVRRLVEEFQIHSEPGHTRITFGMFRQRV